MAPELLSRTIKQLAAKAGFDCCGIASAAPIERAEYVRDWLAKGHAGSMDYLHNHFDRRTDPTKLLEGASSVIVIGKVYGQPASNSQTTGQGQPSDQEPAEAEKENSGPTGRVAMYAWGEDYHIVLKDKLFQFVDDLRRHCDQPFDAKVCVDTVPILEREVAASAGIGWIGKNTLVLNRHLGSYFFLGEIVTTLNIAPDEPTTDHCGSCTACLDACPTDAFIGPYEMDASKCISYLTIEHRSDIRDDLQARMGDWLFGCDVCQEVCPFNRDMPMTIDERFRTQGQRVRVPLEALLNWTIEDYRKTFRKSAVKRAKLDMLKRNARIALSNTS